MFAFIDESGNTGPNLFDSAQPHFYSAAVISRQDLDLTLTAEFRKLAKGIGFASLHAAEIGARGLDLIIPEIQRLIDRDEVCFFFGTIRKPDLVLMKLADTLLDSAENRAVPRHIYNIRAMRLATVLHLSLVTDEDSLKTFWKALMEPNSARAEHVFLTCLGMLNARLDLVADIRARQIIGDAIRWAMKHPEAITVHAHRSARLGHLPHLVVFPSIINAIQQQSEAWKQPVTEIRHDQESLVATALRNWHELISQAPVTTLKWIDMEYPVGGAPGSRFTIVSSKTSAGIQLADVVLWLLRRWNEGGGLSAVSGAFLARLRHSSVPFELSLEGINNILEHEVSSIMAMPMSEDQLDEGRNLIGEMEARRQAAIAAFERDKPSP